MGGVIKKNWDVKYIEKNDEESSFYLYKTLEIQKYLNRFLKIYKIKIQDSKIFYSNDSLQIFISFYITKKNHFRNHQKTNPNSFTPSQKYFVQKKKNKKKIKYASKKKQTTITILDKTKIRKNLFFNKFG